MNGVVRMEVTILVDNPNSWQGLYANTLRKELEDRDHVVRSCASWREFRKGDLAVFLGCEEIVPPEALKLHPHNLVVHCSALPKGKGWSPVTWQVLEGKNSIPIALFEALERVDSGPVYFSDVIELEGHELVGEIRNKVGTKTVSLVLKFVDSYPDISGRPQRGKATFYPRRRPKDSEVDPSKSLVELFDRFRVADNDRYPVFFKHRGHTYVLRIEQCD